METCFCHDAIKEVRNQDISLPFLPTHLAITMRGVALRTGPMR